ncbi:MAG TPA: hypothetical protein VN606_01570, partial [Thermoleophilaceae bacterium]|nr:hypothetical protein [Thermoleophilaceae bacterium]
TYDVERRPIGAQMIEQAYSRYVLRTAPYLGTEGLEPIVDDLTMEIGQIYRSAAVLPDEGPDGGEAFAPLGEAKGRPGTRAPHVWLERDGQRVSTIDLPGPGFVLLAGPEADDWRAAAEPVAELEVEQVGATLADPDGRFADAFGISRSGAVIVRPDGHVAWRAGGDIAASPETVERTMSSLLCR